MRPYRSFVGLKQKTDNTGLIFIIKLTEHTIQEGDYYETIKFRYNA
jgi:hypothetical protein